MSSDTLFRIFEAPGVDGIAADLERLDRQQWQALVEAALLHKCAPMILERFRQWEYLAQVPDTTRQQLAAITRTNAARNLKRYWDLAQLATDLAPATPILLLKGGRLARTHYRDVSLRMMADIDILARPEHLSRVAEKLTALGYSHAQTQSSAHYQEHLHAVSYRRQSSTVELHRTLLDAGHPFAIDYDGIWKRAVPSGIEGCFHLSAEDQLVHLCLHAAYSHKLSIGLYAFIDIGLMCSDAQLDWQELVARARSWRAERCVFLALRMTERLVGMRAPAGVLQELRPADFTDDILSKAAATMRATVGGNEAADRFAYTLAWYMTAEAWRRLPHTLQRRFRDPVEQRSRWSPAEEASWSAQLRPLLRGAMQLLYSRRQWQLVQAHVLGMRLSRWMERSP